MIKVRYHPRRRGKVHFWPKIAKLWPLCSLTQVLEAKSKSEKAGRIKQCNSVWEFSNCKFWKLKKANEICALASMLVSTFETPGHAVPLSTSTDMHVCTVYICEASNEFSIFPFCGCIWVYWRGDFVSSKWCMNKHSLVSEGRFRHHAAHVVIDDTSFSWEAWSRSTKRAYKNQDIDEKALTLMTK